MEYKQTNKDKKANLEFGHIAVSDIKPYKRNVKLHPPKQVRQIRDSIQAFGFLVPIVLDNDNVLIAGHGRIEAVKGLPEYTEVPFIRAKDLTPEQVNAYRLADNKLGITGFERSLEKLSTSRKILQKQRCIINIKER